MMHFDADAMIGAHFAPREGRYFEAADLIEEMDYYGIDRALVYHGLAREYYPAEGNQKLRQSLEGFSRLIPCGVLGPGGWEDPPPEQAVIQMMAEGIRAVRIFVGGPLAETRILDPVSYGDLLAALEARRIPVFLEFDQDIRMAAEKVPELDEPLRSFPRLPIILSVPVFGLELKMLLARLDRHSNLHLETSGLQGNGLIARLAGRFGANRLIFGTRFPWFSSGMAKIALAYAEVSDEDRAAIAGQNLLRLLEGVADGRA